MNTAFTQNNDEDFHDGAGNGLLGDNGREQDKLDSQYKTNDTNEQHEKGTYNIQAH